MADIKLTLSKKRIGDKAEVMIRFYYSRGKDFRAKSRIFVPVAKWNEEEQNLVFSTRFITDEVLELKELKSRLDGLKKAIFDTYLQDSVEATSSAWLQEVVDTYHHPERNDTHIPIVDLIDKYIKVADLADSTVKQHLVGKRIVERFSESHGTLYTDTITSDDLEDLEEFLRSGDTKTTKAGIVPVLRSNNTINSKMKKLAAAFNWAHKKGLLKSNPFDEYEIPADHYGTPIYLTIAERDRIASCDTLSEALSVQRDIFLFQCHVGCRVSDLYSLTTANITADGFLQYIQQKTKRSNPITIRVPLDDTAREIIDRYKGGEKLLPFISYDKYVQAIKKVVKQSGIDRIVIVLNPVTLENESKYIYEIAASHLARKTFAANLFKYSQSERITSSMTGHSPNSKAFARYTEVDDEMKSSNINKTNG